MCEVRRMRSHTRELQVAREAVVRAGRITLQYFRKGVDVERKPDQTPVTIADRRAEESLRTALRDAFPHDGFLGEEYGEEAGTSGRRWIIDPIDGTQSFIRGVPLYGVLVGLEEEGRCVVGICGLPALGQTYWAAEGEGAWCDGERIAVAPTTDLAQATLLTTDARPAHYGDKHPGYERLLRATARQRGWGDCWGYALVASGAADVMVDPLLNPWDAAALVPIVEEAGGAFFAWSGEVSIYAGSGIAAPRALRDPVLALLR